MPSILRGILLFAILTLSAQAWSQTMKQWMAFGEEAMESGEYLQAELYFSEAFTLDSTNFDATIRYADASRLSRNYTLAARLYAKAYDKDKGRLYPEGQYYLAQMQLFKGEYQEALKNFKKYERRLRRNKDTFEYKKIQQEIATCSFALNARMSDEDIELVRLPEEVNTFHSEFSGYFIDSSFFYTASDEKSNAIHLRRATVYDDGFSASEKFTGAWNSTLNHGNLSFSPDGTRAYYVECPEGKCHIYEADYVQGEVMNGQLIPSLNRSDVSSTMPTIGIYNDREVLFFASDWPGSRGQLDIYWSLRKEDGTWDAPVNAGDNINSPGNEISPYYSSEQLYFSSDWHPGFGGFDLFRSSGYPRSFDLAENLGRPMNSSLNDYYFRYFPLLNKGVISSNREGSLSDGSFCCNDLYSVVIADSIPVDTPAVYVSLKELNEYLPVTLYFHNDEPNPRTRDSTTSLSYEDAYRSYLNLKKTYLNEGTSRLTGEAKEDAAYDIEAFFEFQIEKGWNDLSQFTELLTIELEKGFSIKMVIKGFASPRAKSDYNVNLTQRRINSLENYLARINGGALLPYINGEAANHATLTFEPIPFGEFQANQAVSDELEDRQNSIYSIGAMFERKIEIQSVQLGSPDSVFSDIGADQRVKNFGILASNRQVEHTFKLTSIGTDTLRIDSVLSSCGCTVPALEKTMLPPGSSADLKVVFNPENLSGLVSRKVLVFVRGREEPYALTVTAEIE